MRYIRNSVLRSTGVNPASVLAARSAARLTVLETVTDTAVAALEEIRAITQPIIERAAEKGTAPNGTMKRIARIANYAVTAS